VSSFRVSVGDWLRHLLPADLYLRSAAVGDAGALGPDEQRRIVGVPSVLRADFQRVTQLTLDAAQPTVALIARPIDAADPGRMLPLTGDIVDAGKLAPGARPIWVSEAMVDLYGYTSMAVAALQVQEARALGAGLAIAALLTACNRSRNPAADSSTAGGGPQKFTHVLRSMRTPPIIRRGSPPLVSEVVVGGGGRHLVAPSCRGVLATGSARRAGARTPQRRHRAHPGSDASRAFRLAHDFRAAGSDGPDGR